MLLRPGANARRTGTGGHRVFAVTPGTQVVKTSGRGALTRLHDHEAAAAGEDHPTACCPGNHRITMSAGTPGTSSTGAVMSWHHGQPGAQLRRERLRAPASPDPATRSYHAPADHRPRRGTPPELTRTHRDQSRPARRSGQRAIRKEESCRCQSCFARLLRWLRAGYPPGPPRHGYVPLIALMSRPATQIQDSPDTIEQPALRTPRTQRGRRSRGEDETAASPVAQAQGPAVTEMRGRRLRSS